MEALQLQEYDEWLGEHLNELVAQYPAQLWKFRVPFTREATDFTATAKATHPAESILATNVQFLNKFVNNTSVAATTFNKVAVVSDELITKLQSIILFDLNS